MKKLMKLLVGLALLGAAFSQVGAANVYNRGGMKLSSAAQDTTITLTSRARNLIVFPVSQEVAVKFRFDSNGIASTATDSIPCPAGSAANLMNWPGGFEKFHIDSVNATEVYLIWW